MYAKLLGRTNFFSLVHPNAYIQEYLQLVDQIPIKSTIKSLSNIYRIQNSKDKRSPNKKISTKQEIF